VLHVKFDMIEWSVKSKSGDPCSFTIPFTCSDQLSTIQFSFSQNGDNNTCHICFTDLSWWTVIQTLDIISINKLWDDVFHITMNLVNIMIIASLMRQTSLNKVLEYTLLILLWYCKWPRQCSCILRAYPMDHGSWTYPKAVHPWFFFLYLVYTDF
jgi:hypothetical protein